ncbi:MAG: hypothetical protein LUQ69_07770, partial [Methanoregulaceae archaeon]|nr:hypothetical protein [Methanoregulaceae archaeon]
MISVFIHDSFLHSWYYDFSPRKDTIVKKRAAGVMPCRLRESAIAFFSDINDVSVLRLVHVSRVTVLSDTPRV